MRLFTEKSLSVLLAAVTLGASALPNAFGAEFTQEGAQKIAENTNNMASDDSLEASSNSAMRAIMNLSALNIPGAFSNGYKAYGQYINSEKLDNMEARAKSNKGAMVSIGNAVIGEKATSAAVRATSFSRLDPSYLYKGEMAEVAAEFEKRSGMHREEFLRQLGSATDSELTWDDPNLMAKLESRFQQFTASIPNKEFKKGLETAASMLPSSARSEALAKLANFYSESWAGTTPLPVAAVAEGETPAAQQPAEQIAVNAPAAEEPENRAPASAVPEVESRTAGGLLLGLNQNSDALKDLLSAAESPDADSIFRKVSNRYKLLTPALVGKR